MHTGKVIYKKGSFEIVDCADCGFIHLNPIPQEDELREFYRKQYYAEKRDKLKIPKKVAKEKLWYEKVVWMDRLNVFNENVKDYPKRLLDVGCGYGYFLKFMKENGWEAIGIDSSTIACQYAQSLNVDIFNATIEEIKLQFKKRDFFNAINLNCVLEHTPNPREVLEISRDLLKNKGIIRVAVPNDLNLFQLQANRT